MLRSLQLTAPAGLLKDIHRPLLCCLGCELKVTVLLEGDSCVRFQVLTSLDQVLIKHCCISTLKVSLSP